MFQPTDRERALSLQIQRALASRFNICVKNAIRENYFKSVSDPLEILRLLRDKVEEEFEL